MGAITLKVKPKRPESVKGALTPEELALTLIQDHWPDEVLLIAKVADQEIQKPLAGSGIGIGRFSPRVPTALDRPEQRPSGVSSRAGTKARSPATPQRS